MAANKVNKIFITGHSLGAAISTLQGAFLKEKLGAAADIKVRGYGLPRVGNLDWAYVFSHLVEIRTALIWLLPFLASMWRPSWASATNSCTCTLVEIPSPVFHRHLSSVTHTRLVKSLIT